MKYALALHTSSPDLGLAFSNFADDSRCQTWNLGRDLSTHLHHYLAEFIQPQTWTDLAFVAVAKGPGGFTGTRIGVVTARTLAQQLNIPLFAISTLAAVAWSHHLESREMESEGNQNPALEKKVLAVQMPAQREQLFTALYELSPAGLDLTQLMPDTVMTPEEWIHTLKNLSTAYQLINIPAGVGLGATVASVLKLAYLDWQQGKRPSWAEALPFYGQHPVEDTKR